jgi:hypothetical protein
MRVSQIQTLFGPITGDCLLIHAVRKIDTFRSQSQGMATADFAAAGTTTVAAGTATTRAAAATSTSTPA